LGSTLNISILYGRERGRERGKRATRGRGSRKKGGSSGRRRKMSRGRMKVVVDKSDTPTSFLQTT